MSNTAKMSLRTEDQAITYTVAHRGNCVFITGSVPAQALPVLAKLVPEDSVIDPDAARVFGCNFAFGPEAELKALRDAQTPALEQQIKASNPGLSEAATKWLAGGERGVSSNTIFEVLTGIKATNDRGRCHPWDPADFRRCELLLEQVPELRGQFHRMSGVSPQWEALVEAWYRIVAALNNEDPEWREGRGGRPLAHTGELIRRATGR